MTKNMKDGKITRRDWTHRVLKATLKALIVLVFYGVALLFLGPLFELVPDFAVTIQAFVIVYVVLTVIGDLTKGTILHAVFNGARALLVVFYMVSSLGSSVISVTAENVGLTVDISLFLAIATILSLLGLATSVLEAIHFLNEKAELESGMQL